eukprot:TRINITY_DN33224_c0_g2_i1.p2 TRINITY_DN33224_c0_g2~~TRINITY_DN33224_c0_g2_i1.p2  ORF type:complete len:451 (+),score=134.58 TRINITY_DN33224_c0_g2_i1:85-1353(+)
MAELADWGIQPAVAPSTHRWLVLKRPKAHARSKDLVDSSSQTGSPEGAEQEHRYRVRNPPESSSRGVDSSTDTGCDRREDFRATWDAERIALRRTADLSGQHGEAVARCHQKAFRGLAVDQKRALVVEWDELEGRFNEAAAKSDALAGLANQCGRRPLTPSRERMYARRDARKLAVLAVAFPGSEARARGRELAEQAAAWERIEGAARAAREQLAAQAPAPPTATGPPTATEPPTGAEQWAGSHEAESSGAGREGGGAALCIVNLVRNRAALDLLRREERTRCVLRGEMSALWAEWKEQSRRLAERAARQYLAELLVLVEALTGPACIAAEEDSARAQTAREESLERAAALSLRLRDEPAERLRLRIIEGAAWKEIAAGFQVPHAPRPPAAEPERQKPLPYVPPRNYGWWLASSVRSARGWA